MDSIHDHVVERLMACRGEWDAVAAATDISVRTIEKIARREIADPRIRKVEKLARYFGVRWSTRKSR